MDPPAFQRNRLREKVDQHSISEEIEHRAFLDDSSDDHLRKECDDKERLSDPDIVDDEIDCFILSPEEKELKQKLWKKLNKDWLDRESSRA